MGNKMISSILKIRVTMTWTNLEQFSWSLCSPPVSPACWPVVAEEGSSSPTTLKMMYEQPHEPFVGHVWSYQGQSTGSHAGGTDIWRGTWVRRARLIPPHPPSWSLGSQTGGRAEPSRQWPGAKRDRPISWCLQVVCRMTRQSSKVWVDSWYVIGF